MPNDFENVLVMPKDHFQCNRGHYKRLDVSQSAPVVKLEEKKKKDCGCKKGKKK